MGATTGLALLSLASAGSSAYGQVMEAQDQAQAEMYNATVARQEAELAKQQGKSEADKIRRQAKILRGTQKSLYSKAGVALSGSAIEVINDSAAEMELDAMLAEYNADVAAQRASGEASFSESQAKQIRRAGTVSAGSTLLTEVASFSARNFGSKKTLGSEQ